MPELNETLEGLKEMVELEVLYRYDNLKSAEDSAEVLWGAIKRAFEAKDTTHKEEKRRILEGMPCERVKFESNCDHDCQEVVCEDFTEEFYHYGLNAHVQESKAYRDKELNNL